MKSPDPVHLPLWREEVSIFKAEERYVSRRQFGKFLILTSLAMFIGNVWILVRAWLRRAPAFPRRAVVRIGEVPVGGVKPFFYPGADNPCLLLQPEAGVYVAYSQLCTHLSCAVYYEHEQRKLVCPCHDGYFSVRTGAVLQGPPPRALPRILLERRGDEIVAVGVSQDAEV
jgi:Rieske Fe-S protein